MRAVADVQIGFIERERLNLLGDGEHQRADLQADGAVNGKAWRREDELRATLLRAEGGHGGMDAIAARRVTGGGNGKAGGGIGIFKRDAACHNGLFQRLPLAVIGVFVTQVEPTIFVCLVAGKWLLIAACNAPIRVFLRGDGIEGGNAPARTDVACVFIVVVVIVFMK